jgi:hypothetical protein
MVHIQSLDFVCEWETWSVAYYVVSIRKQGSKGLYGYKREESGGILSELHNRKGIINVYS